MTYLLHSRKLLPLVLLLIFFFFSGFDKIHACSLTLSNNGIYVEGSIHIGDTWHQQSCFLSNTHDTTIPDEITNDCDVEEDDTVFSPLAIINRGSFFHSDSEAGLRSLFQ